MATAYHYTTAMHLHKILQSGELLPTSAGCPEHEKPVLWFSLNSVWEPTATKMKSIGGLVYSMSMEELRREAGIVRFSRPADGLLKWDALCRRAGIKRSDKRLLEHAGKKQGANPAHWLGTMDNVPLAALKIEVMGEGGKWESL